MSNKTFTADQFTAGECHTAEEKAKFGNHFVRFLLKGCPWGLFHKWFYQRLSNTFSHIAHYDRHGFYATWFDTHEKRESFIQHMLAHPCYGQPEYTYCDVERAIQSWYSFPPKARKVDAAFQKRKEQEEGEANAEAHRMEVVQDQTSQDFRIVAKSETTGGFGHYEYIVVAKDGSTFNISIIPSNCNHAVGDTITTPLQNGRPTWGGLYVECPTRLKDAPPEIVKEVWAEQVTSA